MIRGTYWKLRAALWFRLYAGFWSWEFVQSVYEDFIEVEADFGVWSPKDAVREELSRWGD